MSSAADSDLTNALAEVWFCQLLIVSAIMRCFELLEHFRGYINSRAPRGGSKGVAVGCGLLSSHAQRRNKKKLDILIV